MRESKEERLDKLTLLKESSLFRDISEESLGALAAQAELADYAPDDSIIRFGEQGKYFGIVMSGKLEVTRTSASGDVERLNVLSPGDYFGEMSLMTGEPTSANVSAVSETRVLLVPHEAMYPVIAREPGLAASLARMISRRLVLQERDGQERARLAEARRAQEDPYNLTNFLKPGMGRILTVNCGSSSLKYRLFDSDDPENKAVGCVERIGLEGTRNVFERNGRKSESGVTGKGYAPAFEAMIAAIGGESALKLVSAVGHRVVHGGMSYGSAAVIDKEVLAGVRECEKLAPLHIPANIAGIEEAMRRMPSVPHVAVFDTGFHQTIPRHARIYGLPYGYYAEDGVRRYGFHGMSHKFVSLQAATFLRKPANELEMITCHLGNGVSLAAVDHGRCIDTTMGMTPLEGLIMGTRSGDVDPGALLHLMREKNLSVSQMEEILMRKSGLLGLSGISSDMREILKAASDGNDRALLAVDAFCYRIKKYIGAFWAALGGLDVLVFTGGIGENSAEVRARVCQGLAGNGVVLEEALNRRPDYKDSRAAVISAEDSPVTVLVVPTDEERMIARETVRAISRKQLSAVIRIQDIPIPIGISAHHVHLCKEHVETLFGEGHKLTPRSPLTQPGQFACEEQVTLVGPKGRVERVRVLGPEREFSQVEISRTEEFKLGIDAPVRLSGDLEGTPGVQIEGPEGSVLLENGVICAQRHIHMSPEEALRFGIHDRDVVMVRAGEERSLIFGDVVVRVKPSFKLELHLDTDEANAAELDSGMTARLHAIQSRK
jgi:acetate kinase